MGVDGADDPTTNPGEGHDDERLGVDSTASRQSRLIGAIARRDATKRTNSVPLGLDCFAALAMTGAAMGSDRRELRCGAAGWCCSRGCGMAEGVVLFRLTP